MGEESKKTGLSCVYGAHVRLPQESILHTKLDILRTRVPCKFLYF